MTEAWQQARCLARLRVCRRHRHEEMEEGQYEVSIGHD
jgi:hypothetical protein